MAGVRRGRVWAPLMAVLLVAALALSLLIARAKPAETAFDHRALTHPAALGLMLQEETGGLYVLAVSERSPASTAGIRPGDLLTSLNGTPLNTLDDMDALLESDSPAQQLSFVLLRSSDTLTIRLAVAHEPPS